MNNVITGVSNMKSHIILEILHVLKTMKHGNNMFVDIDTVNSSSRHPTRLVFVLLDGHDAASVM